MITQLGDTRTLVLLRERPESWQTLYRCAHWSERKRLADRAHASVRAEIDPEIPPFSGMVDIEVTVYFDKQPQDADNILSKLYIDGLQGWWLGSDDPGWVRSVKTVTNVDKSNPRMEIKLIQVTGPFPFECQCCFHRWPSEKARDKHEKTMALSGADQWG